MFSRIAIALIAAGVSSAAMAQITNDPFPPIEATQGTLTVKAVEFAKIPDAGTEAPRLMHMVDEPGTKRYFVAAMQGGLYAVSYDGKTVTPYLDINAANWNIPVQTNFSERGVQSIAFHPEFADKGKPGYGKFYVYVDTSNVTPTPDFTSSATTRSHDIVLLEWTAKDAKAASYDGAGPKELFRAAKPFLNHNGGQIGFNPLSKRGAADYGLLYVGLADGGSGGDPMNLAQNLNSYFGKLLLIDPLGSNSKNGKYGIPQSNPFVADNKPETLDEIFAYGLRNPQRFNWDPKGGRLLVAEIGQNQIEEISPITAGANLGWVKWEGSHKYNAPNRQVDTSSPRGEEGLTWPIVEYDHKDPLLQGVVAITGITVYRKGPITQLRDKIVFGDNPSGEIFVVDADGKGEVGSAAIRRVLLNDGKTFFQIIKEKAASQSRPEARRADLRFGFGPNEEIFILNKRDGYIRLLTK